MMIGEIQNFFEILLGADSDDLNLVQVAVRSVLTYVVALVLVHSGSRRLFGRPSLFDAIVAIMLGSILSRGIVGTIPMHQAFMAGATLIGFHWILASIAYYTSNFGPLIKGSPQLLVRDGKIQEDQMRLARISSKDLEEALRLEVKHEDISKIKAAYLERNGKISVIPSPGENRVLEVRVEPGVQHIRIEVER